MKKRFTLRNKLLFFLAFFTVVPIVAFAYWTIEVLNSHSEDAVLGSLRGLVRTKSQAIEAFSRDRQRNVEQAAALSDVVGNVKLLVNINGKETPVVPKGGLGALEQEGGSLPQTVDEQRKDMSSVDETEQPLVKARKSRAEMLPQLKPRGREALVSLKKTLNVILADQKEYEEILIISPEGIVIASTFDGHEGKTAKGIEYFEKGLKATFFQHVFVSSITEKLTMVIATPIRDEAGNVLGVFAARLNLDTFFDVVRDLSGLGKTGETIVAKKVGEEVIFMAPTRHDHKAALSRTVEIGDEQLMSLQEAARGGTGSGLTLDYRGEPCLAAWEHIPALDWGILVKIDRSEATQPYMQTQYKTLLLTTIFLCVGVLFALFVANTLVRPLKELQEAAERISKGDINVKISVASRDEIGDLADSFGRMIASIKFLMEESKDEAR